MTAEATPSVITAANTSIAFFIVFSSAIVLESRTIASALEMTMQEGARARCAF